MNYIERGAIVSSCGRYRYNLTRRWQYNGQQICWVMLNPSTADALQDDPTILRVVDYSVRWGFSACIIANLYAWRSTDPKAMLMLPADLARGPKNFMYMIDAAFSSAATVAAWGRPGGTYVPQALKGLPLGCLGKNKNGSPMHPLYKSSKLIRVSYP